MLRKTFSFLALIFFCSVCLAAFAEDISLRATVDSNQITLGGSTRLVLTVNGTQNVEPIELPVIDGFESRYLGPQTQVSIVNGNYSASKSFIYVLFSNKTGTFTVPSLAIAIDGKEYRSDPIQIVVADSAAGGEPKTTSGAPTSVNLQDKIMLQIEVPKAEVYLHEQIPMNVKLLLGGVRVGDVQYPSLDTTGFTISNFVDRQYQKVLDGIGFDVVDFQTTLSATRTGELTIGPAKLQANLISLSQQKGASSMFGADIFDNFFTSYDRRPFIVHSASRVINVLPLPEEGKPEDFTGAVGKYDFLVTATPDQLKVGDPITLRMTVAGQGDLKTINMPVFSDKSFKIYDPQIKDIDKAKVLEQVIVPTTTDIKEVPKLSFSYFDTETKKYETISRGPFPVVVSAPDPSDEFKAVGFETSKPLHDFKEEVGRDIVFIKEQLDDLRLQGHHFYKSWIFVFLVLLYSAAWSTGLFFYFVRRKLKFDQRFARKIKAPKQARQGLERTKALIQNNDPKDFYAQAVKTLTDYIGNRLHIPSGGLTADGVAPILKDRGIDAKVMSSIRSLFDTADAVRFASAQCDRRKMNEDYEELKKTINHLEKVL